MGRLIRRVDQHQGFDLVLADGTVAASLWFIPVSAQSGDLSPRWSVALEAGDAVGFRRFSVAARRPPEPPGPPDEAPARPAPAPAMIDNRPTKYATLKPWEREETA